MAVDLTDGLTPPPEEPVDLFEVLGQLPLMTDNFYLRMQAHNIAITDRSLNQMERDLLERELEREHTPVDEADFLNAWSQMWVFGFFELMRTWNALASKFRNHSRKLMRGDPRAQAPLIAPRWVAENPAGAETALDEAIKRANSLRRMLAEVRTGLAKHQIQGSSTGTPHPGYGRISPLNGSISWRVMYENAEDLISRRDLADECRAMLNKVRRL